MLHLLKPLLFQKSEYQKKFKPNNLLIHSNPSIIIQRNITNINYIC